MVTSLGLAMTFANLLLDFFGDDVDGRVKVRLTIFGIQVRPTQADPDGAGKGPFGNARVIVFEGDARINGTFVEVIHLFELGDDVVHDGFGEGHAMRDENQFHV